MFDVCLCLESMGQLMKGEDVLVERLMQNLGGFSSQMYHRHSLSLQGWSLQAQLQGWWQY